MKLVMFTCQNRTSLGAWVPQGIFDLTRVGLPASLLDLIRLGPPVWRQVLKLVQSATRPVIPLNIVRLLAPIPNPTKIIGIGLNYMDHCREQNVNIPDRPLVFSKFPSSIIGPGEPICWEPAQTQEVDFEVELGIVIGKRARNVPAEQVFEHIFGYTIINDVSARDMQSADRQWVRSKSLDTFCPMGPAVVTMDDIPDPQKLKLSCYVNGEVMQNSSTSEMIFGVRELVADLSRFFTLEPGDIIASGTPNGVGVFRTPKVFLKNGDKVVCEVQGIGRLENPVRWVEVSQK